MLGSGATYREDVAGGGAILCAVTGVGSGIRWSFVLLGAMACAVSWAADLVVVEDWGKAALGSKGIPAGWRGQNWGSPAYDMTVEEVGGKRVLRLVSRNEGSTITKDIKGAVNLAVTPILTWRWKVVSLPTGADSRKSATDDQAAQLYVVWPRFPESLRSQIIGYVWDTSAPAGTIVKSEKTRTVTYVLVRSGPGLLDQWVSEERNVVEDYRKIYGGTPENPGAISVGIDSNDTKSSAESAIGEIAFKSAR